MMKKTNGFTLIELMVVLVIVAILVTVGIPSYQSQISGARRADAQAGLMGLAQAMERSFTDTGTYLGLAAGGANTGAPAIYATATPLDGTPKFYTLTIAAATAATYTLQATPQGGQAGDGNVRLLSTGAKEWDRNDDGDYVDTDENCWTKTC